MHRCLEPQRSAGSRIEIGHRDAWGALQPIEPKKQIKYLFEYMFRYTFYYSWP